MIDDRTRERMAATKRIMDDPRTDPGTREAARNRYQAMVGKYGDPNVRPTYANGDRVNFTSDNLRATSAEYSDLIVEMFRRRTGAQMAHEIQRERDKRRADREREDTEGLAEKAERAKRWFDNFTGVNVQREPSGLGWFFKHKRMNHRHVTDRQLIDFALMKGWDGK